MTSFDKLLHVMEDSEYQHVKELAEEIKPMKTTVTKRSSSSNDGNNYGILIGQNVACIV